MMKIVIDIPKKQFDEIQKSNIITVGEIYAKKLIGYIKKGTPSEQEPNTDILDKISAEIEQAADKQFQIAMGVSDLNERYAHIQMENAYRHSLSVIDKYKAESEEEK